MGREKERERKRERERERDHDAPCRAGFPYPGNRYEPSVIPTAMQYHRRERRSKEHQLPSQWTFNHGRGICLQITKPVS